jgi:hypothetical protein
VALVARAMREPLVADGGPYTVRICGRRRSDGAWEGWVEYERLDGSAAVRNASRDNPAEAGRSRVLGWAGGLTSVYFEGTLERAINAERTT